jgi:hypothetical protein
MTAKASIPSASAIVPANPAADPAVRPGTGVNVPYRGRS